MATLTIVELAAIAGSVQIHREPVITTQSITLGTTSQASAAFDAATNFVLLQTDGLCHIKFGSNPTAGSTDQALFANSEKYIGVPPSGSFKVAAIST